MTPDIDLNAVERKAFRSNFQDGLWDIILGLILLQGVVETIFYRLGWSETAVTLVAFTYATLILIGFIAVKKYIVTPRLGIVSFGSARRSKQRAVVLIFSLSMLLGVVVFAAFELGYDVMANDFLKVLPLGNLIPFNLFTVVAVVVFSLAAYFLDFTRAYLYGWLFGLATPLNLMIGEQMGITVPVMTLLFSFIMISIGLVLFVRFMQTHPLLVME